HLVPAGVVHSAADIQAALQAGELLLEYAISTKAGLLYVLAHDGEGAVIRLQGAAAAVDKQLPSAPRSMSPGFSGQLRGIDPDAAPGDGATASQALFEKLVPKEVWERIKASKRVFVAAHRGLHRLPFEALVTGTVDGKPRLWLDDGPPIAYVQ